MLFRMASSISASVGFEVLASRAAAVMIWPDWQYPHCGTSSSIQATWIGWVRSGESPSMVVTFLPATAEMGVTQERCGWPSMWTVQAPHSDMPHPNLVPVMPRVSRRTQSNGMAGTASTVWDLPFKVNFTAATESLLECVVSSIRQVDGCVWHDGCMERRWNWRVWAGFALAVFAPLSYVPIFTRFASTRDFPWANLLLFLAAGVLLAGGLRRAFTEPGRYRGKTSGSIAAGLALVLFGLFAWGTFAAARSLPPGSNALRIGPVS